MSRWSSAGAMALGVAALLLGALVPVRGDDALSPPASPVSVAQAPPAPAPAPDQPATGEEEVEGTADEDSDYTVDGFIDTYYSHNLNNPGGVADPIRYLDATYGKLRVPFVQFHVEEGTEDDDFGFGLKLHAGVPLNDNIATASHASCLDARDQAFQWIQEAYVRYNTSDSKEALLDLGKFTTHLGYEATETLDRMNYSGSIAFGWAEPSYHFGLRYTYPFDDHLAVTGMLVNGCNAVFDAVPGKSVGLQAAYTNGQWGAVANWLGGDEGTGFRNMANAYVTYTTKDEDYDFALSSDFGNDANAGAPAAWWGLAAYARHNWGHDSVALRAEVFDDPQGFLIGTPGNRLYEVTGTYEHRFGHSLTARLEWRSDFANNAFFPRNGAANQARSQHTLTLGTVAYWK